MFKLQDNERGTIDLQNNFCFLISTTFLIYGVDQLDWIISEVQSILPKVGETFLFQHRRIIY